MANLISSINFWAFPWGASKFTMRSKFTPSCRRGRVFNGPVCVYRGLIPGFNTLSLFIWVLWPSPISQQGKGQLWTLVSPELHLQWLLWFGCQCSLGPGGILVGAEMILCLFQQWEPCARRSCWHLCCAPVNWSELERMRQMQKSSLASQPLSTFPLLPCVLGKESPLPHMCL